MWLTDKTRFVPLGEQSAVDDSSALINEWHLSHFQGAGKHVGLACLWVGDYFRAAFLLSSSLYVKVGVKHQVTYLYVNVGVKHQVSYLSVNVSLAVFSLESVYLYPSRSLSTPTSSVRPDITAMVDWT